MSKTINHLTVAIGKRSCQYWETMPESGLDRVTVRQLPDSRFLLIPSYNEYSKGATKQYFNTKGEALAELTRRIK